MAPTGVQNSPIIKNLASSDPQTRSDALDKLRIYLRGHAKFTEVELLKLWKGLFYCVWMSDKPQAQQALARDLAGLTRVLSEENVLPFFDAFWKTMAREWTMIDALRMDKYLFLVRQELAASFQYLEKSSWSNELAITRYMDILSRTPLNATDAKIPNGLRYHVLDIFVDELDNIDPNRTGKIPLESLLQPVRDLQEKGVPKALRKRAKETLEDDRLADWSVVPGSADDASQEAEESEKSEEEWDGLG